MSEKNPWTTLNSQTIYSNTWISLTEHEVINPSGGKGIYGEVHFKNLAIGIIVLDDEYNTWLVGQYRYPLKAYSWEIPAGGGAFNLDPLESAARELKEETGIIAANWREIQRMHLSNSVSDEVAHVFLAQKLSFGPSCPEDTEDLKIRKLPFEEVYQMLLDGIITDSMSVAAILKVKLMMVNNEL